MRTLPSKLIAGVVAGRTPEFIEMMQVGLGHKSGVAQLIQLDDSKFMNRYYFRLIAQIVVQTGAMIFFMRVARWDIFVSAGLSALIALVFGLALYFIRKPKTAPED